MVDTTEAAYREAVPGIIPQEYLADRAVESGSHLDKHLDFYLSVVAFEWLMVFAGLMLFAVLLFGFGFGFGLSLLICGVSQDELGANWERKRSFLKKVARDKE